SRLSAIEKFCPCVTAAPGGPLTSDNGDPMINDAGKHEVKKRGAIAQLIRRLGVALLVWRNSSPAVSAREGRTNESWARISTPCAMFRGRGEVIAPPRFALVSSGAR